MVQSVRNTRPLVFALRAYNLKEDESGNLRIFLLSHCNQQDTPQLFAKPKEKIFRSENSEPPYIFENLRGSENPPTFFTQSEKLREESVSKQKNHCATSKSNQIKLRFNLPTWSLQKYWKRFHTSSSLENHRADNFEMC